MSGKIRAIAWLLACGLAATSCKGVPLWGPTVPRPKVVAKNVRAGMIDVDGDEVFFVTHTTNNPYVLEGTSLHAVAKRGGKPRTLYKVPKGGAITELAVRGGEVIIAVRLLTTEKPHARYSPAILAVPKKGGEPRTVAQHGELTGIVDLALDETHAYYVENFNVRRVPLAGGASEVLYSNETPYENPVALTVDGHNVYISAERNALWQVAKSGGDAKKLIVHSGLCLRAYQKRLYWSQGVPAGGGGGLNSIPLDGRTRDTKDADRHLGGACPLVFHRGLAFVLSRTEVRAFDAKATGGFVDRAELLDDRAGLLWADADDSGVFASTASGSILHQKITFK